MTTAEQTVEALMNDVGPLGEANPRNSPHVSDAAMDARRDANTQIYENSPLFGSGVEQHYQEREDRLFGDKPPNLAIVKEKPEHRVIIFLKAQGLSNTEIAEKTGYTGPHISQVLRQPWARTRLVAELTAAGRDSVTEIIKASATDSVFTIMEIRDNEDAPASARLNAASDLLDRYLGKPTSRVEHFDGGKANKSMEELDKELAMLRAEQARLAGGAN